MLRTVVLQASCYLYRRALVYCPCNFDHFKHAHFPLNSRILPSLSPRYAQNRYFLAFFSRLEVLNFFFGFLTFFSVTLGWLERNFWSRWRRYCALERYWEILSRSYCFVQGKPLQVWVRKLFWLFPKNFLNPSSGHWGLYKRGKTWKSSRQNIC